MKMVFTPEAEHLSKDIDNAKVLEKHPNNNSHRFSDGESYMRCNLRDSDRVLLTHSGFPNPNEGLKRVYSFLQYCKNNNIEVDLFFSYFPFQRQDEAFREGEINEVEHIIDKLLNYYDVQNIYAVDTHFEHIEYDISVFDPIEEGVLESFLIDDNIFLLGADEGASKRYDIPSVNKIRKNEDDVEIKAEEHKEEIRDSTVIIVDDMIASGGTMRECVEEVADFAPKKIHTYSTHLLGERADNKNLTKIDLLSQNFVTSNSVKNEKSDIVYDVREKIFDIAMMDE